MSFFRNRFRLPSKKRAEQEIADEIRRRVFEKEQALLEQKRREEDAEIHLGVLEEMTEILSREEIQAIDREVRDSFRQKQGRSLKQLVIAAALTFLGMFSAIWHFNGSKQTAPEAVTEPPREIPSDNRPATQLPPAKPATVQPKPKPAENFQDKELAGAVRMGLLDIATALLDKGADVNTRDEKLVPVLHTAAIKKHERIVKLLLSRGADVNLRDDQGNTALMQAAYLSSPAIVKMLTEAGTDLSIRNRRNQTAIIIAGLRLNDDAMRYLAAKGGKLDEKDPRINLATILDAKSPQRSSETIKLRSALLDPNIDVAGSDFNASENALMTAAALGKVDLMRLLIDMGAQVNGCDRFGNTALISAAYRGQVPAARLLLEKGAYVNVKGKYGFTPLICAVEGGCHLEFMKLLMEHNADVTVKSESGNDVFVYGKSRCGKAALDWLAQYQRAD